jgi:3-oxoacyl-[acyl-carrier protein] reductase
VNASFEGKHVLVTGGARGIGLEIARHFAAAGATVSVLDTNEETLRSTDRAFAAEGRKLLALQADVTNRAQVDQAVGAAEARAPIDVLVNNAGIAAETPFLAIEEGEWRRILDVNLTGAFHVAQAVARKMAPRRRGAIVNMASKNGLAGEVGYAHYNASKGGMIMLTKTMALELGPIGIRVNAVCPGYIETPMSKEIDSPEFVSDFVERYIPLGRPGAVDEVAPVFLFLASDAARFITGEVFVVDGGQLAGQKPGAALRARMLPGLL